MDTDQKSARHLKYKEKNSTFVAATVQTLPGHDTNHAIDHIVLQSCASAGVGNLKSSVSIYMGKRSQRT